MTQDPLAVLLAEALRNLVDVRALEGVGYVLHQVEPRDTDRLRSLLGPKMSFEVGLSKS